MRRDKVFLFININVLICALIFLVFNYPLITTVHYGTMFFGIWTYHYSVSETYLIYIFIIFILMNILINSIPEIKKSKNKINDFSSNLTLIITFLLVIFLLIHPEMVIFLNGSPASFEYLWPGGYSLIILIISYIIICCFQVFHSFFYHMDS